MVTSRIPFELLQHVVSECRRFANQTELLFVTNLIEGDVREYDNDGLSMSSQYYHESEISSLLRAFEALGFSVHPFYNEVDFIRWASDRSNETSGPRWKLVVTTAEGGDGEGRRALIPAFCNLVGLPCWNSPAHGSSVARHKFHANKILSACGVRVPAIWYYSREQNGWRNGDRPVNGQKVIIKPAWEGGSKGIDDESVLIADTDLSSYVARRAEKFGQACVVQEFKTGFEVGAPIVALPNATAAGLIGFSDGKNQRYGNRARTFLDEKINKSAKNFVFEHIPAAQCERAMLTAERAFDILSMRSLGRIDMRIDEDGEAWIFDTNESPPPVPRSSFVQLFENLGLDYHDVLALMIGVNMLQFGKIGLPSGITPEL